MQTPITELFGIEFPIVAFTHCRDVVAAVSRAGGLGVLGAVNRRYAHKIPFIVKLNHNELLTHPNQEPNSRHASYRTPHTPPVAMPFHHASQCFKNTAAHDAHTEY